MQHQGNNKLAALAALAGLAQTLGQGPRQDAENAAREQQGRVSSALQLLGLQQQQQSEAAQQAFRQQQLGQSSDQFQQSQGLAGRHEDNNEADRQAMEQYRQQQLGVEQQRYAGEAQHNQALETQQSENNKRMLQLGVLQQVREAQMSGQPADAVLKYAGRVDPEFGQQQQDDYWKNTGQSYDQNLQGFNAIKDHTPIVDSTFFSMNHVPAETRGWLQQQLPQAAPQAPSGPSQLGELYKQSGIVGAAPAAVATGGIKLGDLMSAAFHGMGHAMFGQGFDTSNQQGVDALTSLMQYLPQTRQTSPALPTSPGLDQQKRQADQAQTQRLLQTLPQ